MAKVEERHNHYYDKQKSAKHYIENYVEGINTNLTEPWLKIQSVSANPILQFLSWCGAINFSWYTSHLGNVTYHIYISNKCLVCDWDTETAIGFIKIKIYILFLGQDKT